MKQLTLELTGYHIEGTSDLTLWGGGNASIIMQPFEVKRIRDIKDGLNDAGFGVESINGAVCAIYRNYEGTHVFARTIAVGTVSDDTVESYYSNPE